MKGYLKLIKLKAIFYDMDGTLVYFHINILDARKKAIACLENNGIPAGLYKVENSTRETVEDAKLFMARELSYSSEKIAEIISKVNDVIIFEEVKSAKKAKAVNNIEKLLLFARSKGLKQIICTFNTNKVALLTLKTAGIDQYFDDIFGRDDLPPGLTKPNKAHLQVGADKHGLLPENIIMVGDHTVDIDAAKNFGCESIGVRRTGHNVHSVEHADFKVEQSEISEQIIEILRLKLD